MYNMLNDENTYKKTNKDNMVEHQKKVNYVNKIQNENYIGDDYKLKKHNSTFPKIFGLVKLHKEGHPLRAIVSFINSPSYNIAKYFSKVTTSNEHAIKDSWNLKEYLDNKSVPENHILLSLDIESLYTNIQWN